MKTFPIIITEVSEKGVETKQILLSAQDPKDKNQRVKYINEYMKEMEYDSYTLCFDCVNGPLNCPKVADISKKMITDYPFITKGYQVQDPYQGLGDCVKFKDSDDNDYKYETEARRNNLRIEKFVVTGCKNYSRAQRPVKRRGPKPGPAGR